MRSRINKFNKKIKKVSGAIFFLHLAKIISVFLETLCRNVGVLKGSDVLSVSISCDCHISSLRGVAVCRKHQTPAGPLTSLSFLSVHPLPLDFSTNRLNYHFAGAISPWDEHPLQPVNKWAGHFHEASSQKLIAPHNLAAASSKHQLPHPLLFILMEPILHKSYICINVYVNVRLWPFWVISYWFDLILWIRCQKSVREGWRGWINRSGTVRKTISNYPEM